MKRLYLVRHADPAMRADLPPSAWRLSERGRARALRLAALIVPHRLQCIYSSNEVKALETAHVLSATLRAPVVPVPGLHEHERPDMPILSRDQFEQRMRHFFSSPSDCVVGGESADTARRRFEAALSPLIAAPDGDVIVVTHGTVISLFVAEKCGVDAFRFWTGLTLPCAVSLGLPDLALERVTHLA